MMMGAKVLARSLLIIICVGIFCYQMHSSLNKLISQQTMDVTTKIMLSDLNVKPLVTICLDSNDAGMEYLTGRKINQTLISWQFDDLSFDKFIAKEANNGNFHGYLNNPTKDVNFYYPMGTCLALEFDEEIEISFSFALNPGYSVFVTDPSYSNHFSLDLNSHKGSKIEMENNRWVTEFYNIQIEIKDLNSPEGNNLCNSAIDYSYMKCVDDLIQDQMSKVIGCVPPFLSNKSQCTTIFANQTTQEVFSDILDKDYIKKLKRFAPTKAEKSCLKSCKKMEMKVQNTNSLMGSEAKAVLKFEPMVEITSKVVVYGWFEFIIDAGSSLGLWLGLSALGIWDLTVEYLAKIRAATKDLSKI